MSAPAASTATSTDYLTTKTGIIPRLTHSNYPAWNNAMKFALIGIKGWRIANGEEEEPEVGLTQRSRDAHENFQDRADKALSLIYGSVTQALQSSIAGFTPARPWTNIWDAYSHTKRDLQIPDNNRLTKISSTRYCPLYLQRTGTGYKRNDIQSTGPNYLLSNCNLA